jgi:hypothetical protein
MSQLRRMAMTPYFAARQAQTNGRGSLRFQALPSTGALRKSCIESADIRSGS